MVELDEDVTFVYFLTNVALAVICSIYIYPCLHRYYITEKDVVPLPNLFRQRFEKIRANDSESRRS